MFETERPLSKRQLGWLLIASGVAAATMLLIVTGFDLTPAAWALFPVALGAVIIGLTLLPLGDTPA